MAHCSVRLKDKKKEVKVSTEVNPQTASSTADKRPEDMETENIPKANRKTNHIPSCEPCPGQVLCSTRYIPVHQPGYFSRRGSPTNCSIYFTR